MAQVIAGLDIGTHSLKMVVAQRKKTDEDFEILAMGEEPSAGVRKGAVVDPEQVSRKIISLKERVENASSKKVRGVIANIGGSHIFVSNSHGIVAVSRADANISKEDVERVLQAAQAFSLPSNKEILEIFPQRFFVDGEEAGKEVVGMKGVRLEADIVAVCAFSPYVKNVTDAILSADLEILDLIPSPLMGSPAVITPQQKELGVAVVDIGAGTTGLGVFEEGDLIHTAVFPVGSENITNDIAIGLRTEPDIAERIKIEFGTCASGKGRRIEKLEMQDAPPFSFSHKLLTRIIEARVKEIFQLVNKELRKIGKQGTLPGGVVLIGGGAKLPKIVDFAKKELKLPVRIGTPHGIVSLNTDPVFLGAMGLIVSSRESEVGGVVHRGSGVFRAFKRMLRSFIP